MKTEVPSEAFECELFAGWLEERGYLFSHLSQNTFTRSWAVKAKLKRAGVRKGVPDYIICLKNKPRLCFIEMKRVKGGKQSPDQVRWIKAINQTGNVARVCEGFSQACEAVCAAEK